MLKQWVGKVVSSIENALREARRPAARQQRRVLLRLQQLEDRDCPSTVTWTGPDGGNWNTPGNWSTGSAPAATDDVVFNGSYSQGSCYVTNGSNSQLANSITLQGNYQGKLHLGQSYPTGVGAGGIELDGGAIEQDSGQPIYDGGNFTWTGGDLNANSPFLADLNLSSGKSFNASGTANDRTGDNINLTGSNGVINKPGAQIEFLKNAGVNIDSGSIMNLVDGKLVTTGTGVIKNAGTLQKTAGTGIFTTDLPIVNTGAFQLQNGSLTINKSDGKGSFDQSSGSTDLWASAVLNVNQGYYMNGGNLWTEGAAGSFSAINGGNVLIEGGVINLLHGNQTATGTLQINKNLTIQGTAEYDTKIDSTNLTADKIAVTGTVTLGGNSTLKAVSINLVGGKVAVGKTWQVLSSGAAAIGGNFGNFILDFNDGTGKKYTAAPNGNQYEVKS